MKRITVNQGRGLRCQRCGGNAYLETIDEPELRCMQCSRLIATLDSSALVAGRKRLQAAA